MQELAEAGDNRGTILSQLRAADNDITIAMPNLINSQLVYWFQSPVLAELTNTLVYAPLAATLASAAHRTT